MSRIIYDIGYNIGYDILPDMDIWILDSICFHIGPDIGPDTDRQLALLNFSIEASGKWIGPDTISDT